MSTYASPGAFLSCLDTVISDPANVGNKETAVIHAIGTLNQVLSIFDLAPDVRDGQCKEVARFV